MRTWEMMIKELTENPEKKFYDKNEPEAGEVYFDGRAIRWQKTAEPLKLTLLHQREWEEVKEPVTWEVAFKAGLEGKMIKPEGQYLTFQDYRNLNYAMSYLAERPDYYKKIMLGNWYIED